MTETVQDAGTSQVTAEKLECYICGMELASDKSMEIPLTTGGNVKVHPSCMEFYLSQAKPSAAACGGCSGNAGCC